MKANHFVSVLNPNHYDVFRDVLKCHNLRA